jgi:hypothetical protein
MLSLPGFSISELLLLKTHKMLDMIYFMLQYMKYIMSIILTIIHHFLGKEEKWEPILLI